MRNLVISAVVLSVALSTRASGVAYIVQNGQANAAIVTTAAPLPMVRLAAEELQTYVEKISGATLPIVTNPSPNAAVQIYVGRSCHTERLGVTDDGLKHGAYRIASGKNWLALVGHDSRFDRPGKAGELLRLARSPHNSPEYARLWKEWDRLSGGNWGLPYSQYWKTYNRELDIAEHDDWGSFNAVCDFLRMQGVRWYMPDPLGNIVPTKQSIALPEVNRTVMPDFVYRHPYQYGKRFSSASREEIMWQLRMGFHQAPEVVDVGYIAHGIGFITGMKGLSSRPDSEPAPADYYALFGGKRDISREDHNGKQCLSSKGLLEENIRYARAMFDIFDAPMVSVMPADGFTSICQCDGCKDQSQPERGWRGQYSNYVWDYVNKVAMETYKTHPDRKICGMAYTTYMLPPTNIKKFSPNVVVCIAQGRVTFQQKPDTREDYDQIRSQYLALLPEGSKQLCQYEYYRYAVPGKGYQYMPAFSPHAIAADLHALKDISFGDYIEVYRGISIGITHLNLYVTARALWDADLDIDALLEEYYDLYYGPVRNEMKRFIEYSEANWMAMKKSADKIDKAFELLAPAVENAPPDSVYAQRVALIADYIEPMKDLRKQLTMGRGKVPRAVMVERNDADVTIDGKLDDEAWQNLRTYPMKEIETGRPPRFGGRFHVFWKKGALYFGIRCDDPDMETLNIGATRDDDGTIWTGDCVEIELETQVHSYYQLAISPSGALMDLDRKDGVRTLWASNAEVATDIGPDYWTIEIRIPVADESQESIDPLNGVAGRMPSNTYPWFFNICRQRVRETGREHTAFSPTGHGGFHYPLKFAELGGIIRSKD